MERGSDKHSARLDDQMEHEVAGLLTSGHQTHAEEWKEAEPSGEDQPDVDLVPDATLVGGVPDGMTEAGVAQRSELATYLGKEVWPASGSQLVALAREREAPDAVVNRLAKLPPERSFGNLQEVWHELTGATETHRF